MMRDKKHPAEGLLIGLLGGKPKKSVEPEEPETETEEEDSSGPDLELMGQEVLDAIEAKDATGLAESLMALFEACGDE